MPIISCDRCSKEFYRRPCEISRKKNSFCSVACASLFFRDPLGDCVCHWCSSGFRTNPAYIKRTPNQKRFCSTDCFLSYKRKNIGKPCPSTDSNGYHGTSCVNKRYHRFIVEEKIGRKLSKAEHVHHIDGNRKNNDQSNLMILSMKDHMTLHSRKRWSDYESQFPIDEIMSLYESGISISKISSRMGFDRHTVSKRIKKYSESKY